MPRHSTITPEKAQILLDTYRQTDKIADAARNAGVSRQAAARYLASIPVTAAPVVVQHPEVVEAATRSVWETRLALDENYARLLALTETLEKRVTDKNTDDPPFTVYLASLKEVREHIMAGIKLKQLMVSVDEVRVFQQAVLEAIEEADSDTRARIIRKLGERNALTNAVGGP